MHGGASDFHIIRLGVGERTLSLSELIDTTPLEDPFNFHAKTI